MERQFHPSDHYIALDRLMEALEDLLQGDYPRQQLSSPSLEALIFQEMKRVLELEKNKQSFLWVFRRFFV